MLQNLERREEKVDIKATLTEIMKNIAIVAFSNTGSAWLWGENEMPEELKKIIEKFYLDGTTGNGAYHAGFYKQLRANGSGVQFADKSGGIDVMYSNDNGPYPVKQSWSFRGYVSASTYFVWEPEILIMYRYPVTVANLRFLL